MEILISKYNYCVALLLFLIGCYGIMTKHNLFKKVIALSIGQSAIMLFYISIAVKNRGGIPIVPQTTPVDPALHANPLPHVLMLTAIVVGVATVGLALVLIRRIYETYGSVEGHHILKEVTDNLDD